jgi:L-rhamnose mutarotase
MIWTKSKINYAFVFEYDTRHTLEWRQLLEVCLKSNHRANMIHADSDSDSILFHLSYGSFHVA